MKNKFHILQYSPTKVERERVESEREMKLNEIYMCIKFSESSFRHKDVIFLCARQSHRVRRLKRKDGKREKKEREGTICNEKFSKTFQTQKEILYFLAFVEVKRRN